MFHQKRKSWIDYRALRKFSPSRQILTGRAKESIIGLRDRPRNSNAPVKDNVGNEFFCRFFLRGAGISRSASLTDDCLFFSPTTEKSNLLLEKQ